MSTFCTNYYLCILKKLRLRSTLWFLELLYYFDPELLRCYNDELASFFVYDRGYATPPACLLAIESYQELCMQPPKEQEGGRGRRAVHIARLLWDLPAFTYKKQIRAFLSFTSLLSVTSKRSLCCHV